MSQTKAQLLGPVLGTVEYAGDVNFDSGTLFVDSANNRVGVGLTNPNAKLDVNGLIRSLGSTESRFTFNNGTTEGYIGFNGAGLSVLDSGNLPLLLNSQGTNYIIASTNGEERLRIDSSGRIGIGTVTSSHSYIQTIYGHTTGNRAAGTVYQNATTGTDSSNGFLIGNSNGTDAYIWNYESANIQFATGGQERLRITTTGNVGIGITNPSSKLEVYNGDIYLNSTDKKIFLSDDYDQYITANSAANYMAFAAANQERLRITSSGVLLVNNTSTSDYGKLEVKGGIADDIQTSDITAKTIATFSGSTPGLTAAGKGAGIVIKPIAGRGCNYFIGVANDSTNQESHGRFIIRSGNFSGQTVERLRIDSSGNVGIGTDNPASTLHVQGTLRSTSQTFLAIGETTTLMYIGDPFTANTRSILFNRPDGVVTGNVNIQGLNAGVGYTSFSMQAQGGNIGIGTTNPAYKLHVLGKAYLEDLNGAVINNSGSNFGFTALTLHNSGSATSSAHNAQILFDINGGATNATRAKIIGGKLDTGTNSGYLAFQTLTNGTLTEKLFIDSNGNIKIDSSGDGQDIQILPHSANSGHGQIYLRGNASGEYSSIKLNHYGYADYFISAGQSGLGLFSITRTGGGSDGIVINGTGNVGIGTTNPIDKLHVEGIIRSDGIRPNSTYLSPTIPFRISGSVLTSNGATSTISFSINNTGASFGSYIMYVYWYGGNTGTAVQPSIVSFSIRNGGAGPNGHISVINGNTTASETYNSSTNAFDITLNSPSGTYPYGSGTIFQTV